MADLLAPYDPSLEQKRQAAEQSAGTAAQYASSTAMLPQRLKQAIMEKLNYNQDILTSQNKAMADYFAAPSEARQKYQDILNPFDREALVSRASANAYAPYATLSQVLANRQGTIADVVGAGTAAAQAESGIAQSSATLARQAYEDALSGAQWQYEQTHAKPSSAQPKSAFEKLIEDQLAKYLLGGDQNTKLEEPPMSPVRVGIQQEYPPGSGVIWVSNAQGGWD